MFPSSSSRAGAGGTVMYLFTVAYMCKLIRSTRRISPQPDDPI